MHMFSQAIYLRNDRCNEPLHSNAAAGSFCDAVPWSSLALKKKAICLHFRSRHRWRRLWTRTGGWYRRRWRALDGLFQLFQVRLFRSACLTKTGRFVFKSSSFASLEDMSTFWLLGDKRRSHRQGFDQSCRTTSERRPLTSNQAASLHCHADSTRPQSSARPCAGLKAVATAATSAGMDQLHFRLTWGNPGGQAAVSRHSHT